MPPALRASKPTPTDVSTKPTLPWQTLKKRRGQLIASGVLLAIWIVFLVAMAAYN